LRDVIEIGANVDLAESMEIRDEDYEKDYLMTVNLNDDGTISYESLLNSYTNVREKIIEDALGEEATINYITINEKIETIDYGKTFSLTKIFNLWVTGRKGRIITNPLPKGFSAGQDYFWRGKDTIPLSGGTFLPLYTTNQAPEMLTSYANYNLSLLPQMSSSNFYKVIYLSIKDDQSINNYFHTYLTLGPRSMYDISHRDASYTGCWATSDKYLPSRIWGGLLNTNTTNSNIYKIPHNMMNYCLTSMSIIANTHPDKPLGSVITNYKIRPSIGTLCGLAIMGDLSNKTYCWREMHELRVTYKKPVLVYDPNN
jgi:hypothetical protein